LHDVVRFVGRVPHDEIAPYFWASDVFALASYESRHAGGRVRDVETMGRVLCEANAAGVPLVATATGGTPSVVRHGDNGLLVPPNDPNALADGIARVLRDREFAARLGHSGIQRAGRDFDWSAVMTRHETAIERALGTAELRRA
jgi:glycosyltransferase involved in cell wall biosynthesis